MKKIKHSKFKNTGILFEMLVRQVAADTMHGNRTKALSLIKKHFRSGTELGKELQLYRTIHEESFKSENSAEKFLSAAISARKQLNESILRRQKYNLIKDIRDNFILENLFKSRVSNYKVLASTFKLFEYAEVDNPAEIVKSKHTLVEHIMRSAVGTNRVSKQAMLSEKYQAQDKDVRLLSYKMLVDKFNDKYDGLNAKQKGILREYINNVTNTVALKEYVQSEIPNIKKSLIRSERTVGSKIVKIKLKEVLNMINQISEEAVVKDRHILTMLRYYQLLKELKNIGTK